MRNNKLWRKSMSQEKLADDLNLRLAGNKQFIGSIAFTLAPWMNQAQQSERCKFNSEKHQADFIFGIIQFVLH